MLAEKIDLEKDRDAVHRYDEALRQWHAQVLEVEKTTRSLQTTHDLDPRLRQNEIAAWEENSQRQFHRSRKNRGAGDILRKPNSNARPSPSTNFRQSIVGNSLMETFTLTDLPPVIFHGT